MARAPKAPPPTAPAPMSVRSVRLPDVLWGRLEEVCATLNHGRRKPVGVSSVVRALLERGLNDPGDSLDFDGKVMRPERAIRARAARLRAGEQERVVAELHRAVERLVDRLEMTPLAFARALGGNRIAAQRFLQTGAPPDGDSAPFLERVRVWIEETEYK